MTSDLTERLRNPAWTFPEAEDISVLDTTCTKDMAEAADKIEEQADEIERLQARLDECSNNLRLLAAENIRLTDQEEK